MSQVWCENYINIWLGFFTTRVLLEVLEKIHEKRSTFCSGYDLGR